MKSNSVTCLGVGDGWPCADRNHAAFLYRLGGTTLLIDCGEPVDRSFKGLGLGYDSLDAILLSHLHADHCGGLFMLMQGLWLEQRRRELPIHLPGHAIKPLAEMFKTCLLFDELLPFRRKLLPLKAGAPIKIGSAKITPHPTTHLNGLKSKFAGTHPGRFEAFSFLIESGPLRIAHSADLGAPSDLDPLLARPVDLLVCEMAHFGPEQILRHLQGKAIGRILFVHLAEEQWRNLPKLRRLAKKLLPDVPHAFARDGERFDC